MNQDYIFSPEGVWFTSDTHFWHENIRDTCKLPWHNVT